MRCERRQPGPELAPFVTSLWYFESDASPRAERVLPSGKVQLLVDLRQARADEARWAGPRTRPIDLAGAAMTRIAGVLFAPGGAAPFLSSPVVELRDGDIELGDLWGPVARELQDELREAARPSEVLRLLEQHLLHRLTTSPGPSPLLCFARRALEGGASVGRVAERSGASRAHLTRVFRHHLGLSPKQYAGLHRFQRALRGLASGTENLAEFALACGYHDQAHMTHDFRKLGGITPGRYRPRPAGHNHVDPP